jgi:hypothetical protein
MSMEEFMNSILTIPAMCPHTPKFICGNPDSHGNVIRWWDPWEGD